MSQVNIKLPNNNNNNNTSSTSSIANTYHHHHHHSNTQTPTSTTDPVLPLPPPQQQQQQQQQQQLKSTLPPIQAYNETTTTTPAAVNNNIDHRSFYEQPIQHIPLPPNYYSNEQQQLQQRATFPNLHHPLPSMTTANNNTGGSVNTANQPFISYPSMIYDPLATTSTNIQQQQQQQQQQMLFEMDKKSNNNNNNSNNNNTNDTTATYAVNPRSKSDPLLTGFPYPGIVPPPPTSMQQVEPNIITQKDIKILKALLPMSETHKWKYLSHRVSKIRSKKISSEFVKIKYHDFFGLPYSNHRNSDTKYNIEGLIGSSVPYLVADGKFNNNNNTGVKKN